MGYQNLRKFEFFEDSVLTKLFPPNYELMPNVDDIFELEFALGELSALNDDDLIKRSAFICRVNGVETNHYKIGISSSLEIYNNKSIRTRSFFSKGKFSTGYGVHSLFPYRGKFHAQLVKGIINVINLAPGDTVLDPMMGSGTACIEAQMLGMNAIGFDISPFCHLMAKAKSNALTAEATVLDNAIANFDRTSEFISQRQGNPEITKLLENERLIVLLAYLDAMGYARRVVGQEAKDKFPEVLHRYQHTIKSFSMLRKELNIDIGSGKFEVGDARKLPLDDNSIDGIITSPPYSFAIDYVDNDLPQLEFLGVDVNELRERLIGLRGGRKKSFRIEAYLSDMKEIMAEMSRVLRPTNIV
jgi:DNA modification methylase